METWRHIIEQIKSGDKNQFLLITKRMDKTINSYVRKLYMDNPEDVKSELILALWQAVCDIVYYNNDGQIVNYLYTAIKNRYLELYRKSKQCNRSEVLLEDNTVLTLKAKEDTTSYAETEIMMEKLQMGTEGKRTRIYQLILELEMSDAEIASCIGVSRQYVHRLRKEIQRKYLKAMGKQF
jgi:RNA polymerase sigma factor (sigma-70 family)